MPKLGEILEQVSRSEPVDLMKEYHLLGIRLEGGGAFHRETKLGSQVSANVFFKVKSGDFIYSRLFAWRGAFDVIDNSLDSFYVSNEFPTFMHKQDKIDTEFLRLWFRLPGTIAKVEALCSGSTPLTRNRLKEDKFLNLEIPLPSLEEQRRIVARVEELAAKIEEARGLRREAMEEAEELWISSLEATFNLLEGKHPNKLFRDFCDVVRGGSPRPAGDPTYYDGTIPFLKVADLTNHSGKFVTTYSATIKEAGLSRSRYVNAGTLLLTNSGATLGVPKICTFGTCFNDGVQAFLNIPEDISIEYLYYFFLLKTRWFREWAARGQGQPNLNTDMVKTMSIPVPTLTEQKSIVAHCNYSGGLESR